jgi:hypothetical protein
VARKVAAKKAAPKKTPAKKLADAPATSPLKKTARKSTVAKTTAPPKIGPRAAGPGAVQAVAAPVPLADRLRANPASAPELLATAAVEHFGPPVRAEIAKLRDAYPTATPAGLARLTTDRFVRQARTRGAVAGLVGPLAVLVDTAAALWTDAQLVLGIAAAYGHDPTDRHRAAELLVLLRLHPDLRRARAALEAGPTDDRSRLVAPLARLAGRGLLRRAAARRASKLVPGGGALFAAIADARDAERLAARAVAFYQRDLGRSPAT